MRKQPADPKKTANIYFIIAGLIFIFGIMEFNKSRDLEKGLDVIMTFTSSWLYKLGGSNLIILSHLLVSGLILIYGAYIYRKSNK